MQPGVVDASNATDCCGWEGVACADGRVTTLDLGDCGLVGTGGGLHPALFDLTSLRSLDLAGNDLHNGSQLPAVGFERLTQLTHLNLSYSDFAGRMPDGIRRLRKLVSLDLTNWIFLVEGDNDYFLPLGAGRWPVVEPDIASLVANLSNLEELRLGNVDVSGNNHDSAWCGAFVNSTPKLRVLSLPNTHLDAPICDSLSLLRSLAEINLKYNKVYGQIPESLADLPSLRVLRLAYNRLEGRFPARLFQSTNLTALDISYNFRVSGSLPANFSSSGSSVMTELLCSNTNFSGRVPSSIRDLRYLKRLGITVAAAAGGDDDGSDRQAERLPSSIGELRSLTSLQVSGAGLTGELPSWVANLTSLETLQFSNCGLSDQLPSFIGNLENLSVLKLYACSFSGPLPPHLFNLTQLEVLNLHSNGFVGTIELSSFFRLLPNLFSLNLSNNKLSVVEGEGEGYNSSWESSIKGFETLCLASCNLSKLPVALRHMRSVLVLDLSNNRIRGALPKWAWDNWIDSIILMNISHNQFTRNIGYGSVISANMFVIDISSNLFDGPVPTPGPQTQVFDCSNNRFSSMPLSFGSNLSSISLLVASGNKLSGEIPPSICEAAGLMVLDLSINSLFGSIPSCLMEDMSRLNVLNLKGNRLHGTIPNRMLKQDCAFVALDISDNQIEGQLPRSLAACKDLEVFDIGNNHVDDTFPCWMSVLPKLQILVLKSNKFDGNVSSGDKTSSSCAFAKLRIFDLSSNKFSGVLQTELFRTMESMMMTEAVNETSLVMENRYDDLLGQTYKFTTAITYKGSDITFSKILRAIVVIDVSDNMFHGAVPESVGDLVLLRGINLSHNALTGPIPSQLGVLHLLESLDLSRNDLSGKIPQELASLDSFGTESVLQQAGGKDT